MSDLDYCRTHHCWLDADDTWQFLAHYPCDRVHLGCAPMSQEDERKLNGLGEELMNDARTDLQRARALGILQEAQYQRDLMQAIASNLPAPERQRNPLMERIYETTPVLEAEGTP